jgi:hypothetical protein
MADISYQAPKVDTISESERPMFYAWALKHGYTRISTNDETVEELWRDRQGQIISAGRLVIEHPDWRQPDRKEATAPARKPVLREESSERSFVSDNRIQWLRLYPTMALVTILVGALQLAMDSRHTEAATTAATAEAPVSPMPVEKPRLGLIVVRHPNQLEIRWDPKSEAVSKSDRGEMKITENGITEAVPFDQGQLRDGYVAYGPKTNDVDIRLEVSDKSGATTSESVRLVSVP